MTPQEKAIIVAIVLAAGIVGTFTLISETPQYFIVAANEVSGWNSQGFENTIFFGWKDTNPSPVTRDFVFRSPVQLRAGSTVEMWRWDNHTVVNTESITGIINYTSLVEPCERTYHYLVYFANGSNATKCFDSFTPITGGFNITTNTFVDDSHWQDVTSAFEYHYVSFMAPKPYLYVVRNVTWQPGEVKAVRFRFKDVDFSSFKWDAYIGEIDAESIDVELDPFTNASLYTAAFVTDKVSNFVYIRNETLLSNRPEFTYYDFYLGDGTDIRDSARFNNATGVTTGLTTDYYPTYNVSGSGAPSSIVFTGGTTGSLVSMPTAVRNELNTAGSHSVSFWFLANSSQTNYPFVALWWLSGNDNFRFRVDNSGVPDQIGYIVDGISFIGTTTNIITADTWHNVVMSFNTTSNVYNIYVDGFLENTNDTSGLTDFTPGTFLLANDGAFTGDNNRGMKGFIDDLRVYDRALNGDEAAAIYNNGLVSGPAVVYASTNISTPINVTSFTPTWGGTVSNINVSFDAGAHYVTVNNNTPTSWTESVKNNLTYRVGLDSAATMNNLLIVVSSPVAPSVGLTVDGNSSGASVELGTSVNVTYTGSGCVHIFHPEYGNNYSCDTTGGTFLLNPSYFVKNYSNASTTTYSFNLSITNGANVTWGINASKYDDVDGLFFTMYGYNVGGSYPTAVTVYVNDTPVISYPVVIDSADNTLTTFNDSSTEKSQLFDTPSTKTIGYFKIFKGANVTGTTMTITGSTNYTYDFSPDDTGDCGLGYRCINFTKAPGSTNNTLLRFRRRYGGSIVDGNESITNTCWNANSSLISLRIGAWTDDVSNVICPQLACYNSTDWEDIFAGSCTFYYASSKTFTSYPSSNMYDNDDASYVYSVGDTNNNWVRCTSGLCTYNNRLSVYESNVYWSMTSANVFVEVGVIDGDREYNHTGTFTTSVNVSGFESEINSYLSGCTEDENGYCYIPLYIYSDGGSINVSAISINYTYDVSSVNISSEYLQPIVGNSSTDTLTIPITFGSTKNGTIQVSNISYRYAGGSYVLPVTFNSYDGLSSSTVDVTYYYSKWDYAFPNRTSYLEFIPSKSTAKNVTPDGQTNISPILNISSYAYGQTAFNFSLYLNDSDSCIIVYASNSSDITTKTEVTSDVWFNVLNSLAPLDSGGLWMWADYNCTGYSWRRWYPALSFRACAAGTICSESVT